MNRFISFTGSAALAVAAMLASGPPAYSQHHGGGGGGGFHGGGMGGFHGGYGGYGYRGYGGYGGYGYGYPGVFLGLGNWGYGGYYDYPGYYDYGYAPSYYNYSPSYVAPLNYGVQTQSGYSPSEGAARMVIKAPTNAQVWVDNYQVTQSGPERILDSPAVLEPGKPYHYTVKAKWTDNGKPVVKERQVNVQAGQTSTVDFTKPAA